MIFCYHSVVKLELIGPTIFTTLITKMIELTRLPALVDAFQNDSFVRGSIGDIDICIPSSCLFYAPRSHDILCFGSHWTNAESISIIYKAARLTDIRQGSSTIGCCTRDVWHTLHGLLRPAVRIRQQMALIIIVRSRTWYQSSARGGAEYRLTVALSEITVISPTKSD